jgi:hypothetical protein
MLHYNSIGLFEVMLPIGSLPYFQLNLIIQIFDIYDAYTIFTIPETITVLPNRTLIFDPNINSDLTIQDIIVQTISKNNFESQQQSSDFVSFKIIYSRHLVK